MKVSHVSPSGEREAVVDHLTQVAEMASGFAAAFDAQEWAYMAGLAHDIGKYSKEFQKRILEDGPSCDHSTAGAYELYRQKRWFLAYCVAGHHSGLPDGGSSANTIDQPTLSARMKRAKAKRIPDYLAFETEVQLQSPDITKLDFEKLDNGFSVSFWIRMLFSCLVDADYLCTERFMEGAPRSTNEYSSIAELTDRLEKGIAPFFPPSNELNRVRCALLDLSRKCARQAPGVFSLTVPTGGGKTLASMRFALHHASANPGMMRRVIYVAPYTAIIEQNAEVYRKYLGSENVLEHHSNHDFDDEHESGRSMRLAAENWDVPIVVTTTVQFFESLFSNRPSRCRKLHNIVGSVIVLDEAQMLPTKQLRPCLRALSELVHHYGCSIVLCSATQPTFNKYFEEQGCLVREINPNVERDYQKLQRVSYRYEGELSNEELAERLASCRQALCVVNSRRQAADLYRSLSEAYGLQGVFHLSTLMFPAHRAKKLREIGERLSAGEGCIVISTSLIEAGVDIDFPVVYRALAGLDSIVQCAGRCNREGKRRTSESIVHVFEPSADMGYMMPADVAQRASLTYSVMSSGSSLELSDFDFGSLDAIENYFSQLLDMRGRNLDASDVLKHLEGFRGFSIPFKEVAESFRMIEEGTKAILIPDEEIAGEIDALQAGFISHISLRRTMRYSVNVYDQDFKALCDCGALERIGDGVFLLSDLGIYDQAIGLDIGKAGGRGLCF